MKIEWLLTDLDNEIRAYTDLREQLAKLPPEGDEYIHAEADLRIQIMRLKVESSNVLDAIEETN